MSENQPVSDADKMAAFERAQKMIEQINPIFVGSDANDVLLALQLLCAKYVAQTKMDLVTLFHVFAQNLPQMVIMWEKASVDAEAGILTAPFGHNPSGRGEG